MRRIIETERLSLRPITLSDAEDFSVLASDFDIAKMTGSIPHPFPKLSAEIRVMVFKAGWAKQKEYAYAISPRGGRFMGIVSLFRRGKSSELELGYWLGRPYWGNGFMSEACRGIIDEAKEALGIEKIAAGVFHDNPASMRILEKLGFSPTGDSDMYFSMARLAKAESLSFMWHNQDISCAETLESA
ncbi:MAG: GNAT family N-acetyltransferase [Alphaproteobacteria bacterium]